jgi:magnesium-transporting ATPase (P-type)
MGDIVKVYDNEMIPADMLLIFGGSKNRPRSAFVNTKNIDGYYPSPRLSILTQTATTAS